MGDGRVQNTKLCLGSIISRLVDGIVLHIQGI